MVVEHSWAEGIDESHGRRRSQVPATARRGGGREGISECVVVVGGGDGERG